MTIGMSDETRRTAARVVGAAYLIALVPAIFAEFYVRGQLIMSDNAAQTALNIVAHERLFRLGIASNLAVFAIDIALISSLYVVLKPINRSLALMATGWGMVETTILVVVTLSDFDGFRSADDPLPSLLTRWGARRGFNPTDQSKVGVFLHVRNARVHGARSLLILIDYVFAYSSIPASSWARCIGWHACSADQTSVQPRGPASGRSPASVAHPRSRRQP